MAEYIDKNKIIDKLSEEFDILIEEGNIPEGYLTALSLIETTQAEDVVSAVRCKDCIYFQQEQIKTSEGTYRNKFPNEGMVSVDVGINIGSHCKRVVDVREEGFRDGEPTIERTYLWRNEDDFCSRGKRKTDDT